MAQKGISPEEYKAAFELLCKDNTPDRITANMLQKQAGGRYGRASDALENLMQLWRQKQINQQLIPVQPSWYREFVATGIENTREMMEGLWSNIGPHIEERILESTSKLEEQRDALRVKFEEDRVQIELLENELESAEEKLMEKDGLIRELREKLKQSEALNQRRQREAERSQELLQQRADSQLKAERELADVKTERDTALGKLESLRESHSQLKDKLEDVVQKKADLFAAWDISNRKLKENEEQIQKEREKAEELIGQEQEKLNKLAQQERMASLENQSLKTRIEEQNKRVRELSIRTGQQEQDNLAMVKQIAVLEKELKLALDSGGSPETADQ